MKIPVWLATALVTGALGAAGITFEHLSAKIEAMQADIVAIKVDVASVKATIEDGKARKVARIP